MSGERVNSAIEGLFALLKAGLWGCDHATAFAACSDDEWGDIYRIAVQHGVLAVAWDGVRQLPKEVRPPQRLLLQWGVNVDSIEKRYRKQMAVISRLAAFYAGHDIKMMVLKGYALSLYYPVPEHRAYGDIDIWLYGRQPEADKLVTAEWGIPVNYHKEHHTTFSVDGVMVENHFDFMNTKSHAANARVERLLRQYASLPCERTLVGGAEIDLPPVRLDALFLLRHAAVHFAAVNIELRHLADWAVFVVRNHAQIDWPALRTDAEVVGMAKFLDCINALCIDYLSVDAALFGAFERDAAMETRVLNEILQPCFSETMPDGFVRMAWFKTRRWWAKRWKHRIVHSDSLFRTFIHAVFGNLLNPCSVADRK